jgi:integrase
MANKLTPLAVENAKPRKVDGVPVRTEIPDRACPGLFLIVQPSGVKSWALRYRNSARRSRKLTLGGVDTLTLAAARAGAAAAQHEIDKGGDPAGEKAVARSQKAPADSIEVAAAQFLDLHVRRKLRPNTVLGNERIFRRLILPAWRGRNVGEIRRRDVIALVEAIAIDRPVAANRTLAALSKFFNWLAARDIIAASPAVGVERPTIETPRDRVLDDDEVRALWLACGEPDIGLAGPFVKMLLLTGARRNEVCGMRWEELDADAGTWTIPAERSKNKLAHTVPLVPQAWEILSAVPRLPGNFVFTVTGDAPMTNLDLPKKRLDAKLQLAKPWVYHDTRRTVASGLQKLGTRVEVIEAALNHRSGTFRGIVGTYQRHDFADEKRIALAKWADHIERLAGGTPAKVVHLHGARPAS